jgi:uncharacterized membrane protein
VRPRLVATGVAAVVLLCACAGTVVESEPTPAAGPATTLPIEGTTEELLAEMVLEMSRLSAEIGAPGDEDARLARIEALWAVARSDIEATEPQLTGSIEATVDLARSAVNRNRPADGDKAALLLGTLLTASFP